MLDLDDFKLVNDSFGHVYGDRVLVHVAELHPGDAARLGRRRALRRRRVRADPPRDRPRRTRRASPSGSSRRSADRRSSADGRQPFAIGGSMGVATHPRDGRSATDADRRRRPRPVRRQGRRRQPVRDRDRDARRARRGRRPVRRDRSDAAGSSRETGDPSGWLRCGRGSAEGSTEVPRTPAATVLARPPCRRRAPGPILGTTGDESAWAPCGDAGLRIDLRALVRRPSSCRLVVLGVGRGRRGCSSIPTPWTCVVLGLDRRSCAHRRRPRAGGRGSWRGHPPLRGRVVRPDPARPRPVRVARRHRRRDRRGAGDRRPAPITWPSSAAGPRPATSRRSCRRRAPGAPASRTTLPLRELEDPAEDEAVAELAIAAARGRRLTAVPDRARSRRRPRPRAAGPRGGPAAGVGAGSGRDGLASPSRPTARPSPRSRRGSGWTAPGDARPARARTSGSPTGSPAACATPTGCATCSPRRSASTAGSRARSSCRGA